VSFVQALPLALLAVYGLPALAFIAGATIRVALRERRRRSGAGLSKDAS